MDRSRNAPADAWAASLEGRVAELRAQGYGCSQVVLAIGMARLGLEDPDLLRAMEGYCGGACGGTCGALCGGAALFGLCLGKGSPEEPRSESMKGFVGELAKCFAGRWGASTCDGVIHSDPDLHRELCPRLMAETVWTVWGILEANGLPAGERSPGR